MNHLWGWIVIGMAVYLVLMLFAWAFCKAASDADDAMEAFDHELSFVGGDDDIKLIWKADDDANR